VPKYYVNICPWNGREPEVHKEGCVYLKRADPRYTPMIGEYPNCFEAVAAAKMVIFSADGCAFCCPECDHDRTW